jgi:hypothetical protein
MLSRRFGHVTRAAATSALHVLFLCAAATPTLRAGRSAVQADDTE